ncbi:hypothetical protein [Hugenholtzia roseola]|uniref:hypothetical protein n=1 Tax=Hugenholtzia roseola TaxID=1002 RepID=UPI000409B5AB|nr:hypothetical protein [Hugenholtzia roseola]
MTSICIFESPTAELLYLSEFSALWLTWRKQANHQEYRQILSKVLDYMQERRVNLFISNMQKAGVVSIENQTWFREQAVPQAVELGLKRVAIVLSEDVFNRFYLTQAVQKLAQQGLNLEFHYFKSIAPIESWLNQMQGELAAQS